MTPTSRSLKLLRDEGWTVCKVEQRVPIPGMHITRDAYGFGDILACQPGVGIALVQTTSGGNVAKRMTKIKESAEAQVWLRTGGRIFVHGWAKRGARGKAKRWTCRVEAL